MAQWVKNLALSLQKLGPLLWPPWHRFKQWPRKFPTLWGPTKKRKKRERKIVMLIKKLRGKENKKYKNRKNEKIKKPLIIPAS